MTLTIFTSGTKAEAAKVNDNFKISAMFDDTRYFEAKHELNAAENSENVDAWGGCSFNTLVSGNVSWVTLSSPNINILSAGNFYCEAESMQFSPNALQIRLYNTTASTSVLRSHMIGIAAGETGFVNLSGIFTLANTATLQLQQDISGSGGSTSPNYGEKYTNHQIKIWRIN